MGLDITAYEKLTLKRAMTVQQANAEDYDPGYDPEVLLYLDHPKRTQHDGMPEGVYAHEGKTIGFCAGSYGGYNQWRNELARLVGRTAESIWRRPTPGPFVELINFADNEGFIGPATSKKLAADFDQWEERAVGHGEPWFIERYRLWQKAFHLAANCGAVKFR